MPMSLSWVGERVGGESRGSGAAGLGHAVIASSESDKNGLFLSDFGDEDGGMGGEPVYVVFLGIGQNGPDFVRFWGWGCRVVGLQGRGVAGLWGLGAASSESDRIALILSDFGEGASKRFLGVGIW